MMMSHARHMVIIVGRMESWIVLLISMIRTNDVRNSNYWYPISNEWYRYVDLDVSQIRFNDISNSIFRRNQKLYLFRDISYWHSDIMNRINDIKNLICYMID